MEPGAGEPVMRPMDPQSSCPLFTRIPPEIRNPIFELALTAYDDHQRPYRQDAYYYRPGHRYAQKIDTALLSTCRRVYAETETIPATINEQTSWCNRAPPDVHKNGVPAGNSAAAQRRRQGLEMIHLFTQQCWLEGQLAGFRHQLNSTNATRLKITLRHTDWW